METRKLSEKIVTMYAFGQPVSVICKRFNMSGSEVIKILEKSGILSVDEKINIIA